MKFKVGDWVTTKDVADDPVLSGRCGKITDIRGTGCHIYTVQFDDGIYQRFYEHELEAHGQPTEPMENEPKGASKNDKKDCKPDYSLIPKSFMDQVAYVMMAGKLKYLDRDNYKKGHDIYQLTSAGCRHFKHIEEGEDIDWDTTNRLRTEFPDAPEITHWANAAANSLMAIEQRRLGTLKDTRYQGGPHGKN